MSERRKRRTQSAADVELAGQLPGTEPSPLTQRTRRKSNARQARLVAFPQQFYPGISLQNQTHMNLSQPVFNQMAFQTPPMPVYPPPQMVNNSFIFTLLQQQREIPYTLTIDKTRVGKAVLTAQQGVQNLTFSINNNIFRNAIPPIDISPYIIHGNNFLQFCTFGFPNPIFVELKLEDIQNPELLLRKVIDTFPAAPLIPHDPFTVPTQTLEYPGRGFKCQHYQCFDLKEFITRGVTQNLWDCPICRQIIPFEELRYDRDYNKQVGIFNLSDGEDATNSLFSDLSNPFDNNSLFLD
ncbi:MIZ zinc finger family protein [Trichomonas vaginalis G3]|uniref:MIZ zinc finger family protein n=1 Tax=Trichomonas vaginalis (strain ATCC PRA-98 / G3) TaxID=412133 RepID=A2EJC8_TRIV3|nr:tonalli, isoform b family [Trichomonas vaginalis G3]EAY07280.1 MIZ zinc finger family protein [Trichomonas vaginalis G3]KAI5511948.1 tonalli, isoform b family [Trichomonas vaginalis G3]|eukprot:XP_001319503.1 MIZ zinc finger family protein [Trichomonas vaginalis G3]